LGSGTPGKTLPKRIQLGAARKRKREGWVDGNEKKGGGVCVGFPPQKVCTMDFKGKGRSIMAFKTTRREGGSKGVLLAATMGLDEGKIGRSIQ